MLRVRSSPVALVIHVVNRNSYNGPGIKITRGNVLGNPFVIGKDGTRSDVIEKHRQFLWQCLWRRCDVHTEMKRLVAKHLAGEDLYLVCCCAPDACHGDTIKRAILWLAEKRGVGAQPS